MPPLRIVLITGANSGVGLAMAEVLTSHSTAYHVIIAARSLSKAQTALSSISAKNPTSASRLSTVQLDVTSPASITAARDLITSQFNHLDALINNAGIASRDPDISTKFHSTLSTNVIGAAAVADAFRPLLLQSPNPYSIFVSSGAGSFAQAIERLKMVPPEPRGGAGAYHVSKAALNMLALREHIAYAEEGLKVFALCPGFVVSNLRGTTEELRSGWGKAAPARGAGEFLLEVLEGRRDGDVGRLVWREGVYEW